MDAVLLAAARLLEPAGPLRPFERLEIVASVEGALDDWQVEIQVGGAEPRRIEARSCDQLSEATAMIIALAISPAVLGTRESEPIEEPPPVEVRSHSIAERAATPEAPLEAPPRWQLVLRADGHLDLGTMNASSGGLRIVVGAKLDWARLEGWASYGFPHRIQMAGENPRGGDFQRLAGGLQACLAPLTGVVELAGCAGTELGEIVGTGYGVTDPRTARTLSVTVLAGLATAWNPIDVLGLRLGLELGLNALRPVFELEPHGAVHQLSLVVGRLSLGVEVRLP